MDKHDFWCSRCLTATCTWLLDWSCTNKFMLAKFTPIPRLLDDRFSFWHVKFSYLKNMWLCSWLVLQGLRCTECYWLWITLNWVLTHLFWGLLMYSSERSVQFSGRILDLLWGLRKEYVYFPLFHNASRYISMLCHCTHVFLYWMCILIWDAQLNIINVF